VVLKRSHDGHYIFPGTINGRPVSFLLDTGATLVSVPAHRAEELGLAAGAHQQSVTATARSSPVPPGWRRWHSGLS